ncbi:hypothetical protein AN189_18630 [Loktanella sp. 3ANDIMAR09]|uniref:hypothetical protein n=1 Tax=Loktanella sp. 3ANDIMAR09 TaxID=1225657 RepID=UPI0006FDCBA9|nr:hypothetical protein [Loktanella sp. 3ANDIMAR09]KQI66859.1 hypothetical protein AN189_18630 [Loktanella sp. 3ANDIMAR09]
MPRKDEIDRMIVMLYISRNSAGFTNYTRPAGWLDKLPMAGLDELKCDFERMAGEVSDEIAKRIADDMPKFSRRWYDEQEDERAGGALLLAGIGVKTNETQ